jgi:hypothetical protein
LDANAQQLTPDIWFSDLKEIIDRNYIVMACGELDLDRLNHSHILRCGAFEVKVVNVGMDIDLGN